MGLGLVVGLRLLYIVLLLDQHETFLARHAEIDGGRLVDFLDGLLRRGASAGVLAVVATDRSGYNNRLGNGIANRLVLRQADAAGAAVFGADPRHMPTAMPEGRALVVPAGVEVQVALLASDPDGAARAAAVEKLAADLAVEWGAAGRAGLPRRADPLPRSSRRRNWPSFEPDRHRRHNDTGLGGHEPAGGRRRSCSPTMCSGSTRGGESVDWLRTDRRSARCRAARRHRSSARRTSRRRSCRTSQRR